jgi:hypothetical protein
MTLIPGAKIFTFSVSETHLCYERSSSSSFISQSLHGSTTNGYSQSLYIKYCLKYTKYCLNQAMSQQLNNSHKCCNYFLKLLYGKILQFYIFTLLTYITYETIIQ